RGRAEREPAPRATAYALDRVQDQRYPGERRVPVGEAGPEEHEVRIAGPQGGAEQGAGRGRPERAQVREGEPAAEHQVQRVLEVEGARVVGRGEREGEPGRRVEGLRLRVGEQRAPAPHVRVPQGPAAFAELAVHL